VPINNTLSLSHNVMRDAEVDDQAPAASLVSEVVQMLNVTAPLP
jgi:hypothetical protein